MKKFLLENYIYNNIMRAASKHVGCGDAKLITHGVYCEVEPNRVRFTALDGYRMVHYAVAPAPLHAAELELGSFVMPPMPMASHRKINSYIEIDYSDVDGDFGRIHITDKVDDITISRRVFKGDFINYRNIINPEYEKPVSIVVNIQYLSDALAAAIATSDKCDHKIAKITFDSSNQLKPIVITKCGAYGDATHLVLPVKTQDDSKQFSSEI